MRRRIAGPLWLSCAVVCLANGASGQGVGEQLEVGSRVRLMSVDDNYWRVGTVVKVETDTLLMRWEHSDLVEPVAVNKVNRVQVSHGTVGHTAQGAFIGAGATGAAGALFGYIVCKNADPDDITPLECAGLTGIVSALGGGVVGAVVGAMIRSEKWAEVSPRFITLQVGPWGSKWSLAARVPF